jgi:hypothetical protein
MTDNRIGDGDVVLKLDDGEELILKPSWGAAQIISRQYGGVSGAVERVARMDYDVSMQVIYYGLGFMGTKKPPQNLAERIWRTGFTDASGAVSEKVIKYLQILANGGKPLPEDEAKDAGENPSISESSNSS